MRSDLNKFRTFNIGPPFRRAMYNFSLTIIYHRKTGTGTDSAGRSGAERGLYDQATFGLTFRCRRTRRPRCATGVLEWLWWLIGATIIPRVAILYFSCGSHWDTLLGICGKSGNWNRKGQFIYSIPNIHKLAKLVFKKLAIYHRKRMLRLMKAKLFEVLNQKPTYIKIQNPVLFA